MENVDLLDVMFKDIAAMGDLASTPTSGVLPNDLETPKEGLDDTSTDSYSPNDDDFMKIRLFTSHNHLIQHKTKERSELYHHPHRAKGRKEERRNSIAVDITA